jgi:hypothetical protein
MPFTFTLRSEGDQSNPTLARVYGHQSTRGRVVLFERDVDRTKFILLLAQGGRYGCDGIDEYHYNGTKLDATDVDGTVWRFHPGTASLGFDDPDQGRPELFPSLDDTFTEKCYLEVILPASISPPDGDIPDGSEVFMRGLKVMDYDIVSGQLEETAPAFSPNNALVGLDILLNVGKLPLSRFQRWAQSWKDYQDRCDELISWDKGTAGGGVVDISRFDAHIVFPSSITYGAAFEAVLMRSPGVMWQDVNGGIRILPDPNRASVHTFSSANIVKKGVILTPPDPDNLFNFYLATFRDIDDLDTLGNLRYKIREVPPVDLAKLRDANDGILNQFGPIDFGLMNQSLAERMLWYLARTRTMLNAERDTADDPIYPTPFEVKGQMDSFRVAKSDYVNISGHYMVGLQTPLCWVRKETTHAKKGERTFVVQTTVTDAYRDTDHSEIQV